MTSAISSLNPDVWYRIIKEVGHEKDRGKRTSTLAAMAQLSWFFVDLAEAEIFHEVILAEDERDDASEEDREKDIGQFLATITTRPRPVARYVKSLVISLSRNHNQRQAESIPKSHLLAQILGLLPNVCDLTLKRIDDGDSKSWQKPDNALMNAIGRLLPSIVRLSLQWVPSIKLDTLYRNATSLAQNTSQPSAKSQRADATGSSHKPHHNQRLTPQLRTLDIKGSDRVIEYLAAFDKHSFLGLFSSIRTLCLQPWGKAGSENSWTIIQILPNLMHLCLHAVQGSDTIGEHLLHCQYKS